MELTLKRIFMGKTYTIGRLYVNGEYRCDTLEDKVRTLNKPSDKVYGKTAIPEGQYTVSVTYSPKFKRYLPLVENVPYFTGIRIHRGNTDTDTEGCILVGENRTKAMIVNSAFWELRLTQLLMQAQDAGERNTIRICGA